MRPSLNGISDHERSDIVYLTRESSSGRRNIADSPQLDPLADEIDMLALYHSSTVAHENLVIAAKLLAPN